MGKSKEKIAAEKLEAAQENQVKAQAAFDAIAEPGTEKDAAKEVLDAADKDVEIAQGELDEILGNKLVQVRALLPLSGKFLLPHDPGTEFEIDAKRAKVIVDSKYGEYVKEKE